MKPTTGLASCKLMQCSGNEEPHISEASTTLPKRASMAKDTKLPVKGPQLGRGMYDGSARC